jgi:hypothetical protein
VEERKHHIRQLQLRVDSLDMRTLAEYENPLYGEKDREPMNSAIPGFPKLEQLELLVARTFVGEDEEDDELPRFSLEDVAVAKEHFNKVMREKNPRVSVTYKNFETAGDMRVYWKARTTCCEALGPLPCFQAHVVKRISL